MSVRVGMTGPIPFCPKCGGQGWRIDYPEVTAADAAKDKSIKTVPALLTCSNFKCGHQLQQDLDVVRKKGA